MSNFKEEEETRQPELSLFEGNDHFSHKRFTCAIKEYSAGLDSCEDFENEPKSQANKSSSPERNGGVVCLELLSNRALAYISIGNFSAALEDCETVLERSSSHFKAILRKGKALAGLQRYQHAITFLKKVLKQRKETLGGEEKKELTIYLEKLKRMKEQSETGDFYDVPIIMDKNNEPAPGDWVDFISAKVEVKEIPGKGRGLVAAEDLPPSKLILACRAFEILFLGQGTMPEKNLSKESKNALEEGSFQVEDDYTLNLLARKIYDRLVRNPEKRDDFYKLHAGNDMGHLEPSNDSKSPPPALDMSRIYGICRTNTFANSGDSYPEVEKSVGVWLFPAYVNHQCIGGNCTWKIFADYIFVRTFKPIKKGDELTHSYVSPAYPYRARTEVLTKRLGFVCDCVLCDLDRSLPRPVQEEKEKLKQFALKQEVSFDQLDPTKNTMEYAKKFQASVVLLEQIIIKLEKMQPKHGLYNASLLDPLQKLGLKYFGVGEFQKAAKLMERAVVLMRACMLPHGVADCSLWIIAAYMQMGDMRQAKKWGKTLKEYLVLAYGDPHVLKMLGPWVIEPMQEWGLLES